MGHSCWSLSAPVLWPWPSFFGPLVGLFQVATVWGGIGVTLALYATRHLSCAHLNPAVSLAMVVAKLMDGRLLPGYWLAQLCGGAISGIFIFVIFGDTILQYEDIHGITRGTLASLNTAMIFGEYFPNPRNAVAFTVTLPKAMLIEGMGTFLLVSMIFSLTEGCNIGRPSEKMAPIFIGATVSVLMPSLAP